MIHFMRNAEFHSFLGVFYLRAQQVAVLIAARNRVSLQVNQNPAVCRTRLTSRPVQTVVSHSRAD